MRTRRRSLAAALATLAADETVWAGAESAGGDATTSTRENVAPTAEPAEQQRGNDCPNGRGDGEAPAADTSV